MDQEQGIAIALEIIRELEMSLTEEFTSQHELFFDPAADGEGKPVICVSVDDEAGAKKLEELIGSSVKYRDDSNNNLDVPIVIRPLQPRSEMN